ncbi:MAG TPA: Wzz/FepE/Etk N-terminal domain-containing protein [Acetobacteraceae bacterium]
MTVPLPVVPLHQAAHQAGRPPLIALSPVETVPMVSLRDIVRAVFRHKLPMLVILFAALSGSLGYVLLTSPSYTAGTKILVRVGREKLAPLRLFNEGAATNFVFNERPENVNDQIEILRNPYLVEKAFPRLKARQEELLALARAPLPPPDSLFGWVKYGVRTARRALSDAASSITSTLREPLYLLGISTRLSPDEILRRQLIGAVAATFIKETNIIVLTFTWSDPDFAAFAVNAYVEEYRRENMRVGNDLSGAVEFYTEQAARIEAELVAANAALDAYIASSGLSDPAAEKGLILALVTTLERQQSDAQLAEQGTRQRLDAYERQFADTEDWLMTPGIPQVTLSGLAELDARYTELTVARNNLLTQLRPGAREVRDIDGQIKALRRQKLQALQSYFGDRLRAEQNEQAVIAGKLAANRERLERLNTGSMQYMARQDRRDQLLAQLKSYRKQIEDLTVLQGLNGRDFSSIAVLNTATPPDSPTAPNKMLILGLAALFGALLAVAYAILAEFFDRSFSRERDVVRILGLPVIATIPLVRAR